MGQQEKHKQAKRVRDWEKRRKANKNEFKSTNKGLEKKFSISPSHTFLPN